MKRLIFLVMIMIIVSGALPMASCSANNAENPSSNNASVNPQTFEGVTGFVTSREGHPIISAWIQAKSLNNPANPIPEIMILTNGAGEYQWPLSPGRYEISVFIDNKQQEAKLVTVQPGQATSLDFNLAPQE